MLLGYGVSNYRSFKGEAFIDLRPPKGKVLGRFPGNYVELPSGERVFKDAVLVGENAGGKSNFVEGIARLRSFLVSADAPLSTALNNLNSQNAPAARGGKDSDLGRTVQRYWAEVALEDATYRYELEADALGNLSERLGLVRGEGAPLTVFASRRSALGPGDGSSRPAMEYSLEYAGSVEASLEPVSSRAYPRLANACRRPHLLWLAAMGDPRCRAVLDWFVEGLRVVPARAGGGSEAGRAAAAGALAEVMGTPEYLEIVRLADPSIERLEVDRDEPGRETAIVRRGRGGREYSRPVKDDSTGVQGFMMWAWYIYLVVYRGRTVVADEIDGAINPVLSDRVIAFLHGHAHRGQFVFTTHNIFNLSLRTFMKEQINFVTKDTETLESELYSLADFGDQVRYDIKEQLYEFYMRGALGGVVDG